MPMLRLACVLALWGVSLAIAGGHRCNVAFVQSFEQARAVSMQEQRMLLVFFKDGSQRSRHQKIALNTLHTDPTFCRLFVFVELDVRDAATLQLAHRLSIHIVPAISVALASPRRLHEISHFEGEYSFHELRETIGSESCEEFHTGTKLPRSVVEGFRCLSSIAGRPPIRSLRPQ